MSQASWISADYKESCIHSGAVLGEQALEGEASTPLRNSDIQGAVDAKDVSDRFSHAHLEDLILWGVLSIVAAPSYARFGKTACRAPDTQKMTGLSRKEERALEEGSTGASVFIGSICTVVISIAAPSDGQDISLIVTFEGHGLTRPIC